MDHYNSQRPNSPITPYISLS